MSADPRMYKVYEVARMLDVSPMTVYRLIHDGSLRAFHVGRSFRISEPSLNAYMQSIDTWQAIP